MLKWVIRLAWLTGLLGILGSLLILSIFIANTFNRYFPNNTTVTNKPIKVNNKDRKPEKRKLTAVLASAIEDDKAKVHIDPVVKNPLKKPPVEIKFVETDSTRKKLKSLKTTEEKIKKVKDKETEIVILSNEKLQELMNEINREKEKYSLAINCVQLFSTTAENNKRARQQIEYFLRSKKFFIVGREIIEKNIKGIKIVRNGDCIRITIGSLSS